MRHFLTRQELELMTGYRQPAAQRRWLVANGYAFDVRADGRPALLWEQILARQAPDKGKKRASGPDLAALDKLE